MNAKPKPFHLDGKKIAVIALVVAIAGYQWYGNRSAELNVAAEPGNAKISPDEYRINFPGGKSDPNSSSPRSSKQNPTPLQTASGENQSNLKFKPLNPSAQANSSTTNQTNTEVEGWYLLPAGGKNLKSPGGLLYLMSRSGEHRADHVLRHAADQPDRPGSHGVFDVRGDDVFRLIDEAYELVKQKSKQVKSEMDDGKTVLVIDMKRKIGYRGGQKGKRDGYPALTKIKLILGDNRVISAYPY